MAMKIEFTPLEKEMLKGYESRTSAEPRMNLIQLINNIDPGVAALGMNSGPYIALDSLLNDEQIDLACHLKLREPTYVADLAKRAGKSIEETARIADELCQIGVTEYKSDKDGVDLIVLPIFMVGMMEQFIANEDHDTMVTNPELTVGFHHHFYYLAKDVYAVPFANHGVHRPIPIEKAIENEPKKMSWEELSTLIEESANDSYCICECICRKQAIARGEAGDEPDTHWCMPMGEYAEYYIRTGKGVRVTKEEFMQRLKEAEDLGYVHNASNHDGPSPIKYICNCDYQTCMSIRGSLLTNVGALSASNYRAHVDQDKCVACGQCVEKCPMNAVRLGQKLEQRRPVPYRDTLSPAEENMFSWPKKYWNENWQYNRQNVREETGTSPCKTNCPAHVSVQGYLRLTAQGKYDEALKLIKKNNPFPAVCGNVCNKRCEQVCTRGDVDQSVSIDEVKKFVAYKELNESNRYVPKKIYNEGHKIAVIGAGPAGLSCAYYLAERGHHVTVFDKHNEPGGMMRYGIPSFRLEKDIVASEIEVLRLLGVEFKCGVEVGKDVTIPQLRAEGFEGFYVAPGLQGSNKLGIPGEDAAGVMPGIKLMFAANGGEDASLMGKVVVIGGGNIAADVARTAVRCGAESVRMVSLESYDEMPCGDEDKAECKEDEIEICAGWGPVSVAAEDGKCKSIKFRKCLSVKNEEGRFAPKFDDSDIMEFETDYVLYCIGQKTDWGKLLEGTSVELTSREFAVADGFTYQTAEPDVFVGGDAYTGQKFCIDAIAAGKQAAISLHRFVWKNNLVVGRDRNDYKYIDKDNLNIGSYDTAKRQTPAVDLSKKKTFRDERGVFTEEQVKIETSRCLKCGAAYVDHNLCLGCGVCTTRCPIDAISLSRVYDVTPVRHEEFMDSVNKELKRRRDNICKGNPIKKAIFTIAINKGTAKPKPYKGKIRRREW